MREIVVDTYRVKSLLLHVANWHGHLPGQHVDIRLTAEDGYQAQRSYSIASPPNDELLTLTVERVDNGEVSPYLVGDLRVGDQFELRGPIGGYFVWTAALRGPLCLIAGGSGVVPLMAMLRHRDRRKIRAPASLLYSSRSLEDSHLSSGARCNGVLRSQFACCQHVDPQTLRDGWAVGEELIKRCLLGSASLPCKIRKFLSAGPLLSWKMFQPFWWNLDMTRSRSRRNASDLQEDRRHDR